MRQQDDLDLTVQTLIDLDEPEALLAMLQRAAQRRTGERWRRVAHALMEAEATVMAAQSPDSMKLREHMAEWSTPANHARETSQPEPQELTHGKHPDAAAPEAAAATPAPEAPAA
jgi:hypothetical protein